MGRKKRKQADYTSASANGVRGGKMLQAVPSFSSVPSVITQDSEESVSTMNWFDADLNIEAEVLAAPLPDTPLKPPPKKNKCVSNDEGLENILVAIRELSSKQDETLLKISAIETTTKVTSEQIEKLSSTVQRLSVDVNQQKEAMRQVDAEIQKMKKENESLRAAMADCKRYSWRWALKLHGVKEEKGEDTRAVAVGVLSKVAPDLRDSLKEGVDIAHRLGSGRNDGSYRSIIILFAFRRLRDAVWMAARRCKFLWESKIRLSEALSPEDRAAREKLWPLLKKAREEGKKASYRGSYALIDGKKYDYSCVK